MKKVLMLVRREFWENRSLWIAPLVVAGVVLFASATGGIHIGGDEPFGNEGDVKALESLLGAPQVIYLFTMVAFTIFQFVVLGFVVFFYLLDSLLGERKDRSILFWKSLPLSDTQVVTSKVLTALVATPVIVLVVSAVTQLLFGVIWSIRGSGDTGLVAFDPAAWFQLQIGSWLLAFVTVVWYLPLAGYLLLVSVWARRNAFLWAVLPIIGVITAEGLLMRSNHFALFMADRFIGGFQAMAAETKHFEFHSLAGFMASRAGLVFKQPGAWLGAAAAAAMFVAAIRIRRYRDDS